MRILARVQRRARRGVREVRALPRRRDRHSAAYGTGSCQVAGTGPNIGCTVDGRPAEAVRRHAGDSVRCPSIAIDAGHVHIAGQAHRAESMAVNSRAIPGTEPLKRCQRNPADIAESEAKAYAETQARTPSEETDQRRPPVIGTVNRARPPRPTVGTHIPASIVIRSPTPGIAAHPGPAVIIDPDPAADLIRSPARIDVWHPNLSVLRIVHPAAVGVQFLGAVDVRIHVASTNGLTKILITIEIPFVKCILRDRRRCPELGIVGGTARLHGFARPKL